MNPIGKAVRIALAGRHLVNDGMIECIKLQGMRASLY
jgi:hypothetical protein